MLTTSLQDILFDYNISFLKKDKKMEKKVVLTESAPSAIGPYSQAIIAGGLVYTSGQIAIDPKTEEFVGGGVSEQTHLVCTNVKALLEAAGSSLDNAIKTTIFIKDMNDFATINEIYGSYFSTKPARATVEVARLPKDGLVEIDCIAIVK